MRSWLSIIIGGWVLISPWVLGFSAFGFAKWSNVLCGLILVVLGAWRVSKRSMQ